MRIDTEWSVVEERGFTWWAHRLRQRVRAEAPVLDNGDVLTAVRAETLVVEDVPPVGPMYELVTMLNAHCLLSSWVYDEEVTDHVEPAQHGDRILNEQRI